MTNHPRQFLLACLALSLLVLPAWAGETTVEEVRKVQLRILAGDELIDLDLSELEVGDSQQTFAGDGTEIVATRNADAYTIQVGDEEEIVVPTGGRGQRVEINGGDGHHVIVHKEVSKIRGDDHSAVFVGGEGEMRHIEIDGDTNVWVSGDDEEAVGNAMAQVFRMHGKDPAQHLIDSGVLDELDDATRETILEELRSLDLHGGHEGNGREKVIIRRHKIEKSSDSDDS